MKYIGFIVILLILIGSAASWECCENSDCPDDGCYDYYYRDYSCNDGQCDYEIIVLDDLDNDGKDDRCDPFVNNYDEQDDIVEVMDDMGLDTITDLLRDTDLDDFLNDGVFTIFAPSDSAFDDVDLDDLSQSELKTLLKHHIVNGRVYKHELEYDVENILDVDLDIDRDGSEVFVDDAKITNYDNHAKNGVIHVIDEVLIPPEELCSDCQDITDGHSPSENDLIDELRDLGLDEFADALLDTNLDDDFDDDDYTFFVPRDTAFDDFIDMSDSDLRKLIKYHIIEGREYEDDLDHDQDLENLLGYNLEIEEDDGDIFVDDIEITDFDNQVDDVVIHIIKDVILPPEDECKECHDHSSSDFDGFKDLIVKINDREVFEDRDVYKVFDRGEMITISVEFVPENDADDLQIHAFFSGYEHGNVEKVSETTPVFDVKEDRSYYRELELMIPEDLETGELKLRIIISDRFSSSEVLDYNLDINTESHRVKITDLVLDPTSQIRAGRILSGYVRVKNTGSKDEDTIKVKLAIPELDLEATGFIDELDSEDSESSEELFLTIPECAPAGLYKVHATIYYDDGYKLETEDSLIRVTESDACITTGTMSSSTEDIIRTQSARFEEDFDIELTGETPFNVDTPAVFPVKITNLAAVSKSFIITVQGVDFGEYRVDPSSLIVIKAGETAIPYVYVDAANGIEGEKTFVVRFSDGKQTKEILLKAMVAKPLKPVSTANTITGAITGLSIVNGMEIGLIALVVILLFLGVLGMMGRKR